MNSDVCKFIKKCRIEAGLTQEQASECLRISWRTLAYYESGQRKLPDRVSFLLLIQINKVSCRYDPFVLKKMLQVPCYKN